MEEVNLRLVIFLQKENWIIWSFMYEFGPVSNKVVLDIHCLLISML